MKQRFLYLLFFIPILSFAHGGEDHGGAAKSSASGQKYFSSETATGLYEVLIKYGELEPGKPGTFTLFLSNAVTNAPIDSAEIKITVSDLANVIFTPKQIGKGTYQFSGAFPKASSYSIFVSINGSLGPDLMQIEKIEIGKKLQVAAPEAPSHWYSSSWFFAIAGLMIGLLFMYFIMRTKKRRVMATTIIILCLLPTASYNFVAAHDGENHGDAKTARGSLSTTFLVEKESQFLFNILTQKLDMGDLYQSIQLYGTITAAPQGRAVIQTPQTGKIVSLRVTPGQAVSRGQILAIIEQQVDAGTQINIVSQRNALESEYTAAKAQYDRLLKIADIAAKKDITEARARYETAAKNKRLFDANVGGSGSTKQVSLTSPISGVVGTFNYAIGAIVNTGETLFEVTNLNNLYVEAQIFSNDMHAAKNASRFTVLQLNDTASYSLKLISTAQEVNIENQSQKALFEIINPGIKFKIGENVTVRMFTNKKLQQVVVPNDAITEINGKPAVFIKDRAEQFTVSFILKGESTEKVTAISKGIEQDEKIVTTNVYQMKMIYLNQ